MLRTYCAASLLILSVAGAALAAETQSTDTMPGKPKGPPPEAVEACAGKVEGDVVTVKTPRGDTVTATCRKMQGVLVALPAIPPRRGGPPPGDNEPPASR